MERIPKYSILTEDSASELNKNIEDHKERLVHKAQSIKLSVAKKERHASRYARSKRNYNKQFINEMKNLIDFQPTAYDQTCFERLTAYTTLWPPLHTRQEIEQTQRYMFRVSSKERKRIEYLMQNNI